MMLYVIGFFLCRRPTATATPMPTAKKAKLMTMLSPSPSEKAAARAYPTKNSTKGTT